MFSKNVGTIDRIIRLFIGLFAIAISIFIGFNTIVSIIVLIAGIVILLTSVVSFCPIYTILRVDTIFAKEKEDWVIP